MKVLCVGNITYDITTPVLEYPKENSKNRVDSRIECGGGPTSNAAYLLSKWNVETYMAGIIGNDYYGEKVLDEFKSVGVNTDYIEIINNYNTPSSYIIINTSNGSRTILTYRDKHMNMNNDTNISIEPDYILVDGQEYEVSKRILNKNKKAISIIDAGRNTKEVIDLCYMVDYVVCSKEFAESLTHINIIDSDSIKKVLDELYKKFKNNIVITLENLGCACIYNKDIIVMPSIKVNSLDSTGAGDIFHGAFIYGLINNWNIEKILKWSNLAGAMSVTRIGGHNSIFTLEEMEEVYHEFE